MPTKGRFTASACVLFDRPASKSDLTDALAPFEIVAEAEGSENWAFSGPAVVLNYRPEVNGLVAVDTVEHRWPDHMGDPQKEAMLMGAWALGHFGPCTFPGGLQRATQQCWAWPDGKQALDRHRGFVRVQASYIFGLDKNANLFPDDYDPVHEVTFVLQVAAALLRLPGAYCLFNPNGEVLRNLDDVTDELAFANSEDIPPLELISNIRIFNIPLKSMEPGKDSPETSSDWLVMDTVGNGQFDRLDRKIPDIEICFPKGAIDPQEAHGFLRSVTLYLLENGPVIEDGHSINGPGERNWIARVRESGVMNPPRATLRFFAENATAIPPILLAELHPAPPAL